ncbi:MAG TPA: DEAD/DEAH box helicase [Verrucomicrobiales bacterium]|nr:DEAD/DEAH box helicase [Verrucomicrobiales bacterium]
MEFRELGLSDELLRAVEAQGFTEPTGIQGEAIPRILEGRDVIGSSQTGTGKTAAFGLPVLTRLARHGTLRCLILEPTRELAAQVAEHFRELGQFLDLKGVLIHGGVGYGSQIDALQTGVDYVVATPGRLLDHMGRRAVDLRNLEFLILDEVDRMLDMGFLPDVRKIVNACPSNRQTLLFSATMPPEIRSLANWATRDPYEIFIGQQCSPADTVTHAFFPVATEQRDALLKALLEKTDFHSVMIFTRTKVEADRVTRELKEHGQFRVATLHADIRQRDREKALSGFRDGEFDVIVATDLAARGLDISGVTHVINYRVPENAEDYVHRIGRTGRAQQEGDAFTILAGDEAEFARQIERFIGRSIERRRLEGFDYVYTAMLDEGSAAGRKRLLQLLKKDRPKPRRRRRAR